MATRPAVFWHTWFPRWSVASAVLLLRACHPCPAQPALPVVITRPLPPVNLHLNWFGGSGNASFNVYAWTNEPGEIVLTTTDTNVVVSNLARRVYWHFAVAGVDSNGVEGSWSDAATWPVASPPLTNHVVTVLSTTATAETLDGPWETNSAVLFCATNPPGMKFFRQTGLSITITNF